MLRTPRLVLRRFTEHDAGALMALNHDPEVVRWAEPDLIEAPPTLEQTRDGTLKRILAGYEQDPPTEYWAALTRPGGDFAGFFFLRPEPDGAHELGYRLRRTLWGQGLATEGCQGILDAGIATLVRAYVVAENPGSIRVVEKLGLTHVRSQDWRGYEDRVYERRCG